MMNGKSLAKASASNNTNTRYFFSSFFFLLFSVYFIMLVYTFTLPHWSEFNQFKPQQRYLAQQSVIFDSMCWKYENILSLSTSLLFFLFVSHFLFGHCLCSFGQSGKYETRPRKMFRRKKWWWYSCSLFAVCIHRETFCAVLYCASKVISNCWKFDLFERANGKQKRI